MNNNISELVKSHLSIFDKNLQNVKLPLSTNKSVEGIFQLDFLAFYVDPLRIKDYWVPTLPFGVKDNPNWIPCEYENVYTKTEFHWENVSIDYQLVIPWKSPIAILNRWYFKVRQWSHYNYRWRVSIYGKALKLYYMWYIQRLRDYIIKYNWECCRADLCRDFPCKIPEWVIDLPVTWTDHTTTYFWEKNSPLMFRTYDKTEDLRSEKNCFAWFYPSWYLKECWRLEAQITWQYSRSMDPLTRLEIIKVDKSKIQKIEPIKRNSYKTWLYGVIDTIDRLTLSVEEKIDILRNSKKLIENKMVKLQKSI